MNNHQCDFCIYKEGPQYPDEGYNCMRKELNPKSDIGLYTVNPYLINERQDCKYFCSNIKKNILQRTKDWLYEATH